MSNTKDNGGPAFPVPMTMDMEGNFHHSAEHPDGIGGMSLRDYFAAKAPPEEVHSIMVHAGWSSLTGAAWLECITAARLMWADAMLKAREK